MASPIGQSQLPGAPADPSEGEEKKGIAEVALPILAVGALFLASYYCRDRRKPFFDASECLEGMLVISGLGILIPEAGGGNGWRR